jgi:hypothetical protein
VSDAPLDKIGQYKIGQYPVQGPLPDDTMVELLP